MVHYSINKKIGIFCANRKYSDSVKKAGIRDQADKRLRRTNNLKENTSINYLNRDDEKIKCSCNIVAYY